MKQIILISCIAFFTTTAAFSASDKEQKLIDVLRSDAPPAEKAITCKQLAIYGSSAAVPALAPLLENSELTSWARIALEAIPGEEASAALRDAVPKVNGLILIGVINSIGVRHDQKATPALKDKLKDPDLAVAGSAAAALGVIGGPEAAAALTEALASGETDRVNTVSEGAVLCAETFLNSRKYDEAVKLYDTVRSTKGISAQRQLESTRGAILARRDEGLPLLLEQLRSNDRLQFGMGLRTARELKGKAITEAIGQELDRADADRQVMLLLALSDRNDEAVLPRLLQAADTKAKRTRAAALAVLDRFGDVRAVPILLKAAIDSDAEIQRPAKATLTRMEGKAVDGALLDRLSQSSGKTRQVLIELAALRRIHAAVPSVIASAEDSDPSVRKAAFATLSTIGSPQQTPALVKLLSKTKDDEDREGIESALVAICGRSGGKALPDILPLTKHPNSEVRKCGLRVLASMGGPEALSAIAAGTTDPDESIQDEAVGLLATWPNNWPDDAGVADPLLALVKNARKPSYRIQAVRGYLLYLQENKALNTTEKARAIDGLLPELKLPQEKRLAITTLSGIPSARSIELLLNFTEDPTLAEEACLGLVNIASHKNAPEGSKSLREQALKRVVQTTRNDATKSKAEAALGALK